MSYITITTWEIGDAADYDAVIRNIRDKRLPALIALGASRVAVMRTSERTSAAITEWPDKITRDTAERAIDEVRAKIHAEDAFRMTGEMKGEIVAEA